MTDPKACGVCGAYGAHRTAECPLRRLNEQQEASPRARPEKKVL